MKKVKVDIICPLYNAGNYIVSLNNSLVSQKDVDINEIIYILTESKDNSEEILKNNNIKYINLDNSSTLDYLNILVNNTINLL